VIGVLLAAAAAFPAGAAGAELVVRSTIQAAVNAARPGDVVVVPPGRYHESVAIDKSAITIRGRRGAVLDASGFQTGIRASSGPIAPGPAGFPVCPQRTLRDLAVEGLRIEDARSAGVLLAGVDGFRISRGAYVGGEYSIYPVCSRRGVIDHNLVAGTTDGAIYVGGSRGVVVTRNYATGSTIGIEVENSTGIVVRDNVVTGNTAGIAAFVLPRLPIAATEDIAIERNIVFRNNRPNAVAPGAGEGAIPPGTGILAVGTDRVLIRANRVVANNSGGIVLLANPLAAADPRIDPDPDGNEIRDNVAVRNGLHPDPVRATVPGADVVYDGSGGGNCFARNRMRTAFPTGITRALACAPAGGAVAGRDRRAYPARSTRAGTASRAPVPRP
jgi:parallel beta-helix repeat protein